MASKRPKRINLKYGLLVDSKNKLHNPQAARIDGRWDFMEKVAGVGSIVHNFIINDPAPGQGWSLFKIIGSARDEGADKFKGWGIFADKPLGIIYLWFGYYVGGGAARFLMIKYYTPIVTNIKSRIVLVKIGKQLRIRYQNRLLTNPDVIEPGDGFNADVVDITRPITLGGNEILEDSPQKAIVTHLNSVALSGFEVDRKDGAEYLDDIKSMELLGNFVPARLHPYVIAHYPLQERHGAYCFDAVEQYNYVKPQLKNDAFQKQGLSSFTLINETIGGSSITYDSGTNGITVQNGSNTAGSGGRPALRFTANAPTVAGKAYTLEIDIDTNWYVFIRVLGLIDLGTDPTGGRVIKKLNFTEASTSVRSFDMSTFDNTNGVYTKIYSIQIYETLIGPPLKAAPIQLLGYDADDKGETNGIALARMDILTKQTAEIFQKDVGGNAILTNGLRTEIATGLPELKNAVQLSKQKITFDTTAARTIGTGNFSLVIGINIPKNSVPEDYFFYIYKSGEFEIMYAKGRIVVYAPHAGHYLINNEYYQNKFFPVGFNLLCFQKVGIRDFRTWDNGSLLNMIDTQTGRINEPYPATYPDISLANLQGMETIITDGFLAFVGITTENLTVRQQLELHSNGMYQNPPNLTNYKFFYQFNQYSGGFVDLTGLNAPATAPYTGNQLNPAHEDYAIKSLETLRTQ